LGTKHVESAEKEKIGSHVMCRHTDVCGQRTTQNDELE
jgi:hypothetical protein